MAKKSKYVVTDGCFCWPQSTMRDAEKKARSLNRSLQASVYITKPTKRGSLKVIKRYPRPERYIKKKR